MLRDAMQKLIKWKNNKNKKPLMIRGARQVGKTWIMKKFGEENYQNTAYINFDVYPHLSQLFESGLDTSKIITGLAIHLGYKIEAAETLIILDEIQGAPKAINSLKYFQEMAPKYNIVAAGSLLGVALHEGVSFPVGKVEFLDMYPMNFFEFLTAMGKNQYVDLLRKGQYDLVMPFIEEYISFLRLYYFIGGMPEAVYAYSQKQDLTEVRKIQEQILQGYEQDFSKHAPNEIVPRIRMLWESIPAQLSKENKKFVYGVIKEGARAREYETALLWLSDCGLIHRIYRINEPKIPLKANVDSKAFKIFLGDIGLLACMAKIAPSVILERNKLFSHYSGAFTEQFVLQQLTNLDETDIYYWTNNKGSAEIDFIIEIGSDAIPVEAKAETNLQAKSLAVYRSLYNPRVSVRTSMANYKVQDSLINLPLYAICTIEKEVSNLKIISNNKDSAEKIV